MEKVDITKIKLEFKDLPSHGAEIYAHIKQEVPCVEFVMRGDVGQPITYTPNAPILAYAGPWIQFAPEEWREMINEIFAEMVKLWNKKHGKLEHSA